MIKSIYIETYGCQMNVADSKMVASIVQTDNNFRHTRDINDSDVIIINTCSVRDNAEQKIWNRLEHLKGLKKKKKTLKIGIIGCMAQRISEKLLENPAVDFVVGPDAYRSIPDLINEADINLKQDRTAFNSDENYSGIDYIKTDDSISGYISITRGCNNYCSYCIVPYTRGRERSRSFINIVNEAEKLVSLGYKEITLLGQNVNSYLHKDANSETRFHNLIDSLAKKFPEVRLRFTTSHPKDLSDELIQAMAENSNICKHIHLPVQSGSDDVLKKMNRHYTKDWYLNRIEAIRKVIPECGISTDIFCGFPGETDEDFNQTISLMETVRFDSAFMFKYSVRPGTYAADNFSDDVSEDVKKLRLNEMIKLQNSISLESNKKDIGKTFQVLVEGVSKKSDDMMFGRNSQNKVVVFNKKRTKKGDLVSVVINKVSSATLIGEISD